MNNRFTGMLKTLSWWTGVLYLSAFVLNTGLLWFLIRKANACNFVETNIIFVACGGGWGGRFLDIFLLYFSPLVAPVTALHWQLLFSPQIVSESQYRLLVLFFIVSVFVIGSSLSVLRKMVKGFLIRRHDREAGKHAWIILGIILMPALLSFAYRLYLAPPSWSQTTVHVDIWHGRFDVPREMISEWSILPRPRPDSRPNEYSARIVRWWKSVPYLTFEYDLEREIGENGPDEKLQVQVNPHYVAMDEAARKTALEKIIDYRIKIKSEADGVTPIYQTAPDLSNGWQIYRPGVFTEDVFFDLYIRRDKAGKAERILQCTPRYACAAKTRFSWTAYPCRGNDNCNECKKICTELSLGTENYDIRYTFDKRNLDHFPVFDENIRKTIEAYYTPNN